MLGSAAAGRARVSAVVEGVALGEVEAVFHVPEGALALAFAPVGGRPGPGRRVTFPLRIENRWNETVPGTSLDDVKTVHSHVHALGQCRKVIRELGLKPVISGDTAGAAREVAEAADPTQAAISPPLAAEIYGL